MVSFKYWYSVKSSFFWTLFSLRLGKAGGSSWCHGSNLLSRTIKNKKSEKPLFDGEPNLNLKRGATTETVLLQTDLCGNPIQAQQK